MNEKNIVSLIGDCLIKASTTFNKEKYEAYKRAILNETNNNSKWVLENIVKNAKTASKEKSPLCDDTGIPHIVIDIGPKISLTGNVLKCIKEGVANGLKRLPGRPMAILGNDYERLGQTKGVSMISEDVLPAPILIRNVDDNVLKLHILMFGGGPAIRAKTFRIYHKHNPDVVIDEIVEWAKQSVLDLGCTPCTLGIGVGRSHFEATSLMVEALVEGNYSVQNNIENTITKRVNDFEVGPLGLGGKTSVLATFMKIGQQRSSGVRIVCLRPCCCFEPRVSTVDLTDYI